MYSLNKKFKIKIKEIDKAMAFVNTKDILIQGVGTIANVRGLQRLQSGVSVLNFSLAVNKYAGKNEQGEKQYETTWFDASLWGQRAEQLVDYLVKGRQVQFVGKLGTAPNCWIDKSTGEARGNYPLEVVDIDPFTVDRSDADAYSNVESQGSAVATGQTKDKEYDEIPF